MTPLCMSTHGCIGYTTTVRASCVRATGCTADHVPAFQRPSCPKSITDRGPRACHRLCFHSENMWHDYGYTHEQSLAPWHAWPSCTSPETKSLNRFNVLVAQVPRVNGVHTYDATLHVDPSICRLHDDAASELRKSDWLHNGSCACLPTTKLPQVHQRQRSARSPPPVLSL